LRYRTHLFDKIKRTLEDYNKCKIKIRFKLPKKS